MSKRVKGKPRASRADMGARTLEEFEEVQRRQHHARIRVDLIDRGAVRQSVKRALEEAAPRLRAKGWRVGQGAKG